MIHQTHSVLDDSTENFSGESSKSPQICYQLLQELDQVSLALFPALIHQSDVTAELLSSIYLPEQLAGSVFHKGSSSCWDWRFPGAGSGARPGAQALTPQHPCPELKQLYPLIAEHTSPDVKAEFSSRHSITTMGVSSPLSWSASTGEAALWLSRWSLSCSRDLWTVLSLVRHIPIFAKRSAWRLSTKQKLHTTRRSFQTTMLFQSVNVQLQILIHKSHDLLQELSGLATYNVTSVDFWWLLCSIPSRVPGQSSGVDDSQNDVLSVILRWIRTCSHSPRKCNMLVNNLHYHRLCKENLLSVPVKVCIQPAKW